MDSKFLQALHSGRVLLMDGAMGTELGRAGMQSGECYELWNLTHPESVLETHRAYAGAGAEVLLTNTFQANPVSLVKYAAQDRLIAICEAGVQLARRVNHRCFVLGDIGPSQRDFNTDWETGVAFADADGLLLETFSGLIDPLLLELINTSQKPVMISCTYLHDDSGRLQTHYGLTPNAIAKSANSLGIAALGVNCGREIDMDDTIEIVCRYRAVTDLPLFARPNAGTPVKVDGQWVYPHTPDQMAAKLPELLQAGISMVGGCCGTTPAHIAAFKLIIDDWNRRLGF